MKQHQAAVSPVNAMQRYKKDELLYAATLAFCTLRRSMAQTYRTNWFQRAKGFRIRAGHPEPRHCPGVAIHGEARTATAYQERATQSPVDDEAGDSHAGDDQAIQALSAGAAGCRPKRARNTTLATRHQIDPFGRHTAARSREAWSPDLASAA